MRLCTRSVFRIYCVICGSAKWARKNIKRWGGSLNNFKSDHLCVLAKVGGVSPRKPWWNIDKERSSNDGSKCDRVSTEITGEWRHLAIRFGRENSR